MSFLPCLVSNWLPRHVYSNTCVCVCVWMCMCALQVLCQKSQAPSPSPNSGPISPKRWQSGRRWTTASHAHTRLPYWQQKLPAKRALEPTKGMGVRVCIKAACNTGQPKKKNRMHHDIYAGHLLYCRTESALHNDICYATVWNMKSSNFFIIILSSRRYRWYICLKLSLKIVEFQDLCVGLLAGNLSSSRSALLASCKIIDL